MVKYTGPRIRITRRLGLLPGLTRKISDRVSTPGQHGKFLYTRGKRLRLKDDYKARLIEKQKLRFNYGITESQLISYYKEAKRRTGSTGNVLLELLEARLDCIVFRLGFAPTIPAARQLINHGHLLINKKLVNIPSFLCQPGDLISIKENSKAKKLISTYFEIQQEKRNLILKRLRKVNLVNHNLTSLLPSHLKIDFKTLVGKVLAPVKRERVLIKVDELKVLQYYSR
jgi:small subunit ribosomal protein S4